MHLRYFLSLAERTRCVYEGEEPSREAWINLPVAHLSLPTREVIARAMQRGDLRELLPGKDAVHELRLMGQEYTAPERYPDNVAGAEALIARYADDERLLFHGREEYLEERSRWVARYGSGKLQSLLCGGGHSEKEINRRYARERALKEYMGYYLDFDRALKYLPHPEGEPLPFWVEREIEATGGSAVLLSLPKGGDPMTAVKVDFLGRYRLFLWSFWDKEKR